MDTLDKDFMKTPDKDIFQNQPSKHKALQALSDQYDIPFVEYDDRLLASGSVLHKVNLEQLREALWFPLAIRENAATVIVSKPPDTAMAAAMQQMLRVDALKLLIALPDDIIAIIENHQDINSDFPASSNRTTLARLRNWFAEYRVMLAKHRTILAKGRTGLAFMRTGISFISVSLSLFRLFGIGYLTIPEILLLGFGAVMVIDGYTWYLPARRIGRKTISGMITESTFGTTILEQTESAEGAGYRRTPPIPGAQQARVRWNRLSPVQKRRFLAIDRTDLAEERSILAGFRTILAQSRTGLAFTRTGIAFIGLGIAFLRQFHAGPWTVFDGVLILTGVIMMLEGFHWYLPGRHAGKYSSGGLEKAQKRASIWEFMFPPFHKHISPNDLPSPLQISGTHAPGIWGSTGLALERTLIADRRNVKARLRTVMAQSRTGLAFIRTGTSLFSVGMGLQVFFGFGNIYWTCFNMMLIGIGLILMADGSYWHFPAQKIKKQFPYCYGDMEIAFPDYGKPATDWSKVVFGYEDM
jgi:uncharacterized membrane protein YidH (DUF202 family)